MTTATGSPAPPESGSGLAAAEAAGGSDRQLHDRLLAGDAGGFDDLYARYAPIAYGLALRVTRDRSLATEVVHDAFMAVWQSPEAYDPDRGSFRTFLLLLVHRRAVDAVRREERLRRSSERAVALVPVPEDPTDDVAEVAWLRARAGHLRAALGTLPEPQRQVLVLAYFDGLTQSSIAERLGVPLGTVKTRTLAAMRTLRRALATAD